MAFNVSAVIVKTPYSERIPKVVLSATDAVLSAFNVRVAARIAEREYRQNTTSHEINKYIRVADTALKDQGKEAHKLIKTGTGRYEAFAKFSSVRYAFISVSGMGEYTTVWHSFHPFLDQISREFKDFPSTMAKTLSLALDTEALYMHASSLSRNSDIFNLYYRGYSRNSISMKGALTEAKRIYGVDINDVMDNIDYNLAIFYAPADFVEVNEDIRRQRERDAAFIRQAEELTLTDKESGEDMMGRFAKENEAILATLTMRKKAVEELLKTEPIGDVVYFRMEDRGYHDPRFSTNETVFGRDVAIAGTGSRA